MGRVCRMMLFCYRFLFLFFLFSLSLTPFHCFYSFYMCMCIFLFVCEGNFKHLKVSLSNVCNFFICCQLIAIFFSLLLSLSCPTSLSFPLFLFILLFYFGSWNTRFKNRIFILKKKKKAQQKRHQPTNRINNRKNKTAENQRKIN